MHCYGMEKNSETENLRGFSGGVVTCTSHTCMHYVEMQKFVHFQQCYPTYCQAGVFINFAQSFPDHWDSTVIQMSFTDFILK